MNNAIPGPKRAEETRRTARLLEPTGLRGMVTEEYRSAVKIYGGGL